MAKMTCRDPNLLDTVKAYDDTCDFLSKIDLDDAALTRTIVGAIGDIDAYQLPDSKGRTAFTRHLLGITDEERQQRREQVHFRFTEAVCHRLTIQLSGLSSCPCAIASPVLTWQALFLLCNLYLHS